MNNIWHVGTEYPRINQYIIAIYKDSSVDVLYFTEFPVWETGNANNILKYAYLSDLLLVEEEYTKLKEALSPFFKVTTNDDFEPWFRPFSDN